MQSLTQKLSDIMGAAFAAEGLAPAFGAVRMSDRADLAQFQCNGAFEAAKQAKKNPRAVAEAIVGRLQNSPPAPPHAGGECFAEGYLGAPPPACGGVGGEAAFSKLEIAGPGFININITDDYLRAHLTELTRHEHAGLQKIMGDQTVILDYGGPNIAKPMHVGHLRSSIIGDALRRIMSQAGYRAVSDVHMGDWGTPMGQIISELALRHPEWPYFDAEKRSDYSAASPVGMEDLEEIYPKASAACKADERRADLARMATVELQNGRPGYQALWRHFIDVSIKGMKKNFDDLGVHFDLWKGEASAHHLIAPMVEDLKAKNLAIENEGALIVPVGAESDKKEMPPLILYKRDGAVMYGTTDLATIVERVQDYKPRQIIYVVDQRQSLHFEQVFRAAHLSGIAGPDIALIHAGFGTMNGLDGKPFKTRAGGVMKLEDLIGLAEEKARARLAEAELAQDMDEGEKRDVAHKVAIAAIKFADLQNTRTADYVFDLERMTAFEGKTGPYLLYQAVRIRSLLRKAESQNLGISEPQNNFSEILLQDADRSLALLLTQLPDHFETSLRNLMPHMLCDYAYKLAQAFSSFYASCHILSEQDAALRQSRLMLCALTAKQLELVLSLLGIQTPNRM